MQEKRKQNELLTVSQISDILGISVSMVYALVNKGDIGSHRIGRCVRISRSQLDQYLDETKSVRKVSKIQVTNPRHF
jgi:excisionase family DNA binding protein